MAEGSQHLALLPNVKQDFIFDYKAVVWLSLHVLYYHDA